MAISGPHHYSGSSERLEGFLAGLGKKKPVSLLESPFTMEGGYQHGKKLLAGRRRHYSVFCGNDMIAYGLHRAAMERGLDVPNDLAIFGFDDNRMNDWLAPWLSTVQVSAADFGPAIADLIGSPSLEDKGASFILPFQLKLRTSA